MDAEVVIVGLGAMGSAAAWTLARSGVRVMGFEAGPHPGHDLGSSHGESRIIRQAYFEHPAYVPLVREAWALWERLQNESGRKLLVKTGGLMIGGRDAEVIRGAIESARTHSLTYEVLDRSVMQRRFPQFRLHPDEVAVYEPMAGLVRPEEGVRAFVQEALARGADLRFGSRVIAIEAEEGAVRVRTAATTVRAERAIVAAGAWTGRLLGNRLPLLVERQVQLWFSVAGPERFGPARSPIFIRQAPDGRQYYGFPSQDGTTVKVALHHGGDGVEPDELPRAVTQEDWKPALQAAKELIPDLVGPPVRAAVCMYTNSPDGHFIVGPHPDRPALTVLTGFSGHGFKFAPAIGRLAADLVKGNDAVLPLFDPTRFSGRD